MKKGTEIKFVRRNGKKVSGRVVGRETTNGEWLLVNTADKGSRTPAITKIRPSQAILA